MARDYGNPQHRADRDSTEETAAMRQAMASAHSSYTVSSMSSSGSVEVHVMVDMSVFGTRYEDMMSVVFDSCFARFRAEGRYGEMSMTFSDSGRTWYRDTY